MIGEILSNFRVIDEIGRGGMATVYLAEHQLIGTKAAVKVLLPSFSQDKAIVSRFFNEARAAGRIKHPGIIEIYDFGYRDRDGTAYIVMEFVTGESLNTRIHRLGRLVPRAALTVGRHVASCLSHAHANQIIHRDIKPENIMLTPDSEVPGGERAKVLDFGIAKLLDMGNRADGSTRAGAILGTPAYMAPEQSGNAGGVDARADLYSLGCVMYEMLVGQPPFSGETVAEQLIAHRMDTAVPPSGRAPDVPPALDALIASLLEKQPEDRVQSADELVAGVDRVSQPLGDGRASGRAPAPAAPAPTAPGPAPYGPAHDSQATLLHPSNANPTGPPRTLAGYESHTRHPRSRTTWATILGAALAFAAIAAVAVVVLVGQKGDSKADTTAETADTNDTADTADTADTQRAPQAAAAPTTKPLAEKPIDAGAVAPDAGVAIVEVASPDAAPPSAPMAHATLRSKPRASVFIDGKRVGKTPYKIEFDADRAPEVTLKARGHRDRKLLVSANQSKVIRLARERSSRPKNDKPKNDKPKNDKPKNDKPKNDNKSVNPFD